MLILNDSTLIALPHQQGALAAIARDPSYAPTPIAAHPIGFIETPDLDITFITPVFDGNEATFNAGDTIQRIEEIEQGGVIYRLATDPDNPLPGEFIYDSVTGAVRVISDEPLPPALPLIVRSAESTIMLPDDLITNLAQLPNIFEQYELTGEINWSSDWEGHPTGSFDLVCDWAIADALESALKPKVTPVQIFGVGFQVDALSCVKQSPLTTPELTATVSVSLRGKWESLLEESVVLDASGGGANAYGTFGVGGSGSTGGSAKPSGSRTIRGDTSVQAIAAILNVPIQFAYTSIPAPKQSGSESIFSLAQAIEDNLRHNGCFGDYSRADKVRSRGLNSTPIHIVSYFDLINEELEIGINASPRAFDYENSPLEWGQVEGITTSGEDTQGNPKQNPKPAWKLKREKKEVITTGSPTLDLPSEVSGQNKSGVTFAFDNGGPTRQQKTVTTVDGLVLRETSIKKGFTPVACDDLYSYNTNDNKWVETGGLTGTWQTIEELETTYTYDESTGYLTNILTVGTRKLRLKKEGNNESLAAHKTWNNAAADAKAKALTELSFYRYQDAPVREETVFSLRRLRDRYRDIPPPPTEDWVIKEPKFLPDGRLNPAATFPVTPGGSIVEVVEGGAIYVVMNAKVPIPGYTDPHYCDLEVSKKFCLISAPDPDSTEKNPLPHLSAGEDKDVEKAIYIPEPGEDIVVLSGGALTGGDSSNTETFITHEKISTRKDAGFSRSALDITQEMVKGRPGEHTRRVRQFEKLDPKKDQDDKSALPNEFDYRMSTIPPDDIRLVGSSQNYPYAKSLAQALVGAAVDFEINNTRNTKTTKIEVSWKLGAGIEAGDRINLEGHGLWRVLSYAKGLEIVAPGLVQPKTVELNLGKIPSGVAIDIVTLPKEQQGTQSGSVSTTTSTGKLVSQSFNSGDLVV
jgi:hypothetical protein